MFEMLTNFRWLLDLFDIFLVAFIIYRILLLIQGTRAVQMLVGLAVLLIVYVASQIGGLYTLNWIHEADYSYRLDQNTTIRPQMNVDNFGNIFYFPEARVFYPLFNLCYVLYHWFSGEFLNLRIRMQLK